MLGVVYGWETTCAPRRWIACVIRRAYIYTFFFTVLCYLLVLGFIYIPYAETTGMLGSFAAHTRCVTVVVLLGCEPELYTKLLFEVQL